MNAVPPQTSLKRKGNTHEDSLSWCPLCGKGDRIKPVADVSFNVIWRLKVEWIRIPSSLNSILPSFSAKNRGFIEWKSFFSRKIGYTDRLNRLYINRLQSDLEKIIVEKEGMITTSIFLASNSQDHWISNSSRAFTKAFFCTITRISSLAYVIS